MSDDRDPELLAAIDTAAAEMVRRLFDYTTDEPVRDLRTALAEGLYDALLASPDVTRLSAVMCAATEDGSGALCRTVGPHDTCDYDEPETKDA